MDGTFPLNEYRGKIIKITAYGLKYLPPGNYKIIYSERNIEEILDSMEKMIGEKDTNREETKATFVKLNNMIKQHIQGREDMDILLVNYNKLLLNPTEDISRIANFLNLPEEIINEMARVIDSKLYRQRRS